MSQIFVPLMNDCAQPTNFDLFSHRIKDSPKSNSIQSNRNVCSIFKTNKFQWIILIILIFAAYWSSHQHFLTQIMCFVWQILCMQIDKYIWCVMLICVEKEFMCIWIRFSQHLVKAKLILWKENYILCILKRMCEMKKKTVYLFGFMMESVQKSWNKQYQYHK